VGCAAEEPAEFDTGAWCNPTCVLLTCRSFPHLTCQENWAGQASAGAGRLKEGVVSLKKKERGSRGIKKSPDQQFLTILLHLCHECVCESCWGWQASARAGRLEEELVSLKKKEQGSRERAQSLEEQLQAAQREAEAAGQAARAAQQESNARMEDLESGAISAQEQAEDLRDRAEALESQLQEKVCHGTVLSLLSRDYCIMLAEEDRSSICWMHELLQILPVLIQE